MTPNPEFMSAGLDPIGLLRDLAAAGTVRAAALDVSRVPPLTELDPESMFLGWDFTLETEQSDATSTTAPEVTGTSSPKVAATSSAASCSGMGDGVVGVSAVGVVRGRAVVEVSLRTGGGWRIHHAGAPVDVDAADRVIATRGA